MPTGAAVMEPDAAAQPRAGHHAGAGDARPGGLAERASAASPWKRGEFCLKMSCLRLDGCGLGGFDAQNGRCSSVFSLGDILPGRHRLATGKIPHQNGLSLMGQTQTAPGKSGPELAVARSKRHQVLPISWAQYRPMHVSFPRPAGPVAAWLFFTQFVAGVSGWSAWHLVLSALCVLAVVAAAGLPTAGAGAVAVLAVSTSSTPVLVRWPMSFSSPRCCAPRPPRPWSFCPRCRARLAGAGVVVAAVLAARAVAHLAAGVEYVAAACPHVAGRLAVLALVLVYTLLQQLNPNTFMRSQRIAPLHAVPGDASKEIQEDLFQPPVLPSAPPDASSAQVDTVVVVLGEIASAHRCRCWATGRGHQCPRWHSCSACWPPPLGPGLEHRRRRCLTCSRGCRR